ncbi:MAG: hypothetical protein P9M14_17715 [Candidatus Alcyoniella australis]|nr:hypothetical protein [Candidatus Alcyoniella australis]
MRPHQIKLRMPDKPGHISKVSELLGVNGISIKAIAENNEGDQGVLTIVVDDHQRGVMVLRGHGYEVEESPVIAAYAPDHPGGLNALFKPLREAGVNIERLYLSVARKSTNQLIIIQVDDCEKGTAALRANYVEVIEGRITF